MAKPFLPLSENPVDGTSIHEWLALKDPKTFIDKLVTSSGDTTAGQKTFNDLISGVPSPWARAKMTGYALQTNTNDYSDKRTLILCYRALKNEWRGLMATYILFPDRFSLSEPIALNGRRTVESMNIRATYGAMLFKEKSLWQIEAGSMNPATIQLLYYGDKQANKKLVGATSPYSIFFTSVNYEVDGDLPWIVDGKFTDPASPDVRRKVDVKQLEKIYSFLSMLTQNREAYRSALSEVLGDDKYKALEVDHIIREEIKAWSEEIARALDIQSEHLTPVPLTIRTEIVPRGPLSKLFVTNTKYWWHGGAFFLAEPAGAVLIEDISELMLPGGYLVGWMAVGNEADYDRAAVYYLKAKDEISGNTYFFSLPLSSKAIDLFGSLNGIITDNGNSKVRLRAKLKGNEVVAMLEAKLGDSNDFVEILSKAYEIVLPDSNGKVFVWPNFKSEYWKQYFYYSEFPTNMPGGVRMIPEFEGKNFEENYLRGSIGSQGLEEWQSKMFMVKYPVDKANSGMWPYEIVKSDTPLKYVSVHVRRNEKDWTAGRLVIKTPGGDGDTVSFGETAYMKVLNRDPEVCEKATVGIDFGSTNTCAYYKTRGMRDAEPLPFSNHRLAIVGFDNVPRAMAAKDELLFISNEEPINGNGQIKSWLHEHDIQYIADNFAKDDEPIIGGVPVNETNITVHSMNEYIIQTNAGRLNYNMKWARGENEKKRKSFISMVWLQICADLFGKELVPSELRWSFPSAMTDTASLSQVFKNLTDTIGRTIEGVRISKNQSFTEAEAVCVYAQSYSAALTPNNLFLGIDIGGSTSDILILGLDPTDLNGSGQRLYSQCSVRVAAGMFFDAINRSEQFRKALYNFHESKKTGVHVLNIADVVSKDPQKYQRAPYYLNNVFDQLKSRKEFSDFYDHMRSNIPFAFALPAYITGLLAFYAGILLRETITKNNLPTDEIRFRYYGKGGRLFEWLFFTLEDNGREACRYLGACITAGLGMPDRRVRILFDNLDSNLDGDRMENKSEVAKGLVKLSTNPNDAILGINDHNREEDQGYYDDYSDYGESSGGASAEMVRHEVVGEKNITYRTPGGIRELGELEVLGEEMFKNISLFGFNTSKFENFNRFIGIFTTFVKKCHFVEEIEGLREGTSGLNNLAAFFVNDDERGAANYRMPIFIASGLYYLNNCLMPQIFKQN